MDQIAADEDDDALAGMQGAMDGIKGKLDSLGADGEKIADVTGAAVAWGRPPIQGNNPLITKNWRLFEFLRWRRTGQFARNLLKRAADSTSEPDGVKREQRLAYAYGYLCHTAASVAGEPFIENVVGGPYRTHCWRNRYVSNYVDTWTFGFYESGASMNDDDPTPQYADWKNLCSANLQEQVKVNAALTGPAAATAVESGAFPADALPPTLANLLVETVLETYPAAQTPTDFTADSFNQAYVGTYATLWFMTSGEGPLCLKPLGSPPSSCSSPPSWVTGGGSPPSPVSSSTSTGSKIAAAILWIIFLLTGAWVAGLATVALAIAAAAIGATVDWDQLRCNLYWLRYTFWEIENGIRAGLVKGALAYPMTHELGAMNAGGRWVPAGIIPATMEGSPLTRSRRNELYPLQMDATVPPPPEAGFPDLNYINFPSSPTEDPKTIEWAQAGNYPHFVIEGQPLLNGGILADNGAFPTRGEFFGSVVPNALEVLTKDGQELIDYNLDGDRGYGWKTWLPKLGTKPKDPPFEAVDEP